MAVKNCWIYSEDFAMAELPKVLLCMRPVDGGSAVIGVLEECPNCGGQHFTTSLECGRRKFFCGLNSDAKTADGWTWVDVQRILI